LIIQSSDFPALDVVKTTSADSQNEQKPPTKSRKSKARSIVSGPSWASIVNGQVSSAGILPVTEYVSDSEEGESVGNKSASEGFVEEKECLTQTVSDEDIQKVADESVLEEQQASAQTVSDEDIQKGADESVLEEQQASAQTVSEEDNPKCADESAVEEAEGLGDAGSETILGEEKENPALSTGLNGNQHQNDLKMNGKNGDLHWENSQAEKQILFVGDIMEFSDRSEDM
jgi:hypothetical protein